MRRDTAGAKTAQIVSDMCAIATLCVPAGHFCALPVTLLHKGQKVVGYAGPTKWRHAEQGVRQALPLYGRCNYC